MESLFAENNEPFFNTIGQADIPRCPGHVCFTPDSGHAPAFPRRHLTARL
jgi:hypothetical protein